MTQYRIEPALRKGYLSRDPSHSKRAAYIRTPATIPSRLEVQLIFDHGALLLDFATAEFGAARIAMAAECGFSSTPDAYFLVAFFGFFSVVLLY
jgi:hypothetical protein